MPTIDASHPDLVWTAHPAAERPGAAAAAGIVIVAAGGGVWLMAGHPIWGVLAVMLLTVSLRRFYFPSRFALNQDGITASSLFRTQRMRWADANRFVHDERGGFLGTRARGSWLDSFRGMHILFGRERAAVIAAINDHMKDPAGEAEIGPDSAGKLSCGFREEDALQSETRTGAQAWAQ